MGDGQVLSDYKVITKTTANVSTKLKTSFNYIFWPRQTGDWRAEPFNNVLIDWNFSELRSEYFNSRKRKERKIRKYRQRQIVCITLNII